MITDALRSEILASCGATGSVLEELLEYNRNLFDHGRLPVPLTLPLPDQPMVSAWESYLQEARSGDVFAALKDRLIQLQFPIQEGISQTEAYRASTRRGEAAPPDTAGLQLSCPEKLELILHQSGCGRVPVLIARDRRDFVTLVRAMSIRNEPAFVPDSKGSCVVTGYNNWDRIHQYRRNWERQDPDNNTEFAWADEFQRLVPQKELYQDYFMILSDGPYSAVAASDVGVPEDEWRNISLNIRIDHESTHYSTGRLFGSMKNNLIDELIADYMGLTAAIGNYRSDWFLRFVGLENFPDYREGGRLQNYRGNPPLSDAAFRIVQTLVKNAAGNLQTFDAARTPEWNTQRGKIQVLIALTSLPLEALASPQGTSLLQQAQRAAESKLGT